MRISRYLKKSKRKDGTRQIYIRERTLDYHVGTGLYVKEREWDDENKCIRGRSRDVSDMNLVISDIESRIKDVFVKYRLKDIELTRERLKSEFNNPQVGLDFISFAWDYFHKHSDKLKPNTKKKQKSVLTKLDQIFDGQLLFSNLNENAILKIERDLALIHGNSRNTIVSNMSTIKKYINAAMRQDLIDRNPARGMGFKYVRSDRTYLNAEELRKLEEMYASKYAKTEGIHRSLQYYLFMCYTGLRVSDFQELEKNNVLKDSIVLVMRKTENIKKTSIFIPLIDKAKEILKAVPDTGTKKVFHYRPEQKINKDLKRISKDAEINKLLTIHTARHTFATQYLRATNDLAGLQELLGHENIETTRIYIHINQEHLRKNMGEFEQYMKGKHG